MALAIFLARVVNVSLGTIRTILVVRGQRSLGAGVAPPCRMQCAAVMGKPKPKRKGHGRNPASRYRGA